MSETVREPRQQRSIDKKNRIVAAGYELFAQKGYFNTNTAEIAKQAGVSTGIVYGYFRDKKDILLEVLDLYVAQAFQPVFTQFDRLSAPLDYPSLIVSVIDLAIDLHRKNAAMHEALHSLSHADKTVGDKFLALEEEVTIKLARRLAELGEHRAHLPERVHMTMETVQSYAHECVFDRHPYIDYEQMRKILNDMLLQIWN